MYILGINSVYHETSAALLKDGNLIGAVEEERFNRIKHGKLAKIDNPDELPINAINFCLKQGGISLKEVNYIGYSFNPKKRLRNKGCSKYVIEGEWGSDAGEELFYQTILEVPKKLSNLFGYDITSKFKWIDHHLCHAASAYFVSPFKEAAILSVDGIGEFTSTYLGYGKENLIKQIKVFEYPNSLGFLWEKLSKFLGFGEYGASKMMSLASLGNPREYYNKLRSFIRINNGDFGIDNNVIKFRTNEYSALEKLFSIKKRKPNEPITIEHANIAAALQKITEKIMLSLSNYLYQQTQSKNLCLAGGVALNCVSNGVLHKNSPFDNIYIQPASNDAGTAIGAAYFIWNQILRKPRTFLMDNTYLGPKYSNREVKKILDKNSLNYSYHSNIGEIVAKLVADGNIVGWFQGRIEFGPRALGNRSIVADPRNLKIKDIINMKIKHREHFRPYAPSILEEKTEEWFNVPKKSISSDFMSFAYKVIKSKLDLIPAISHVDGSSRIQTVKKRINPRYYRLIQEFEKLTGVPIVLNTSFNDTEPIVCSPQDAINTFKATGIDYLVINNYLIEKNYNGKTRLFSS